MVSVREPPASAAVDLADSTTATRGRAAAGPLGRAALATLRTPPLLPARCWRWRLHHDVAELWLPTPAPRIPAQKPAGARRKAGADRDGGTEPRRLAFAGGVALHQALVALARSGHTVTVERLPDPYHPNLVARLTVTGRRPVTAAAARAYRTMLLGDGIAPPVTRRTAARRNPAPRAAAGRADLLRPLQEAATASGAGLLALPDEPARTLPVEGERSAPGPIVALPDGGTGRVGGTGLAVRTAVARARAGVTGSAGGQDPAGRRVVLFATADTVRGWLAAGEALAAVVVAAGAGGRATVRVGPVRAGPARQVPGARLPGRAVATVTLRIGGG